MTAIAIILVVFRVLWLTAILAGTSYIVFWLGYSGWWWLLALLLMAGASEATLETKD